MLDEPTPPEAKMSLPVIVLGVGNEFGAVWPEQQGVTSMTLA